MSNRTPAQISQFLEENMHRFDVPQQYYGDEPNTYQKDWDKAELRYLIFASWPYEQAAGNQSIPLVYRTINAWDNDAEWMLCDRSYFASTPRDMKILSSAGMPVFGIEKRHQMRDYDIIGTSLSYPVLNINFIHQLRMSDIPVLWEDRMKNPEQWPFVMIGGTSYGAPEVTATVTDCHFAGEVEDEPGQPGIGAVLDMIRDFKNDGWWGSKRIECYKELARHFNFLYFPQFIDIHYTYIEDPKVLAAKELEHPQRVVTGYSANIDGMKLPIMKRVVKDLDAVEGLDNPPLLYLDPGMGAGDIETARGCPAWCSFCALTYRQKPYRQRSVDYMVDFGKRLLVNTGGNHLAPFSPDFPMHTQKKLLVSTLLENVTDDVDSSSMRVDDFIADPEYILLQVRGGMDQVTLGVEGNSQRMRDLVGKGCSDSDIKEAVARGLQAGLRRFKLYMICDLPGEDRGDIISVLNLARDLADIRDGMGRQSAKIQFSWTPLLIEALTPFQWFKPTDPNKILSDVWDEFKSIKIDFKLGAKAEINKHAYFQGCQLASREVGYAMVKAVLRFETGCWGGVAKGMKDAMEEELRAIGFHNALDDVFDGKERLDMFGWEWLDLGINQELLWKTYQNMKKFIEGTNSMTYDDKVHDHVVVRGDGKTYHGNEWIPRCDVQCQHGECGACDPDDLRIRKNYKQDAKREIDVDLMNVKVIDQKSELMKVRCQVWKDPAKRFVQNDHWRFAVRRAAFRSGIPITKRSVRFASEVIKYKDWMCGVDYVEFSLVRKVPNAEVESWPEKMNQHLVGLTVNSAVPYPANTAALRNDVDLSLYEMEIDTDVDTAQAHIEKFRAADYVKMVLKKEMRMAGIVREEVNCKDYVSDLWLVQEGHRLKLRSMIRGEASPYNVFAALMEKASWIDSSRHAAVRLEAFIEQDDTQFDFFRPDCEECGMPIPTNPLNLPFSLDLCPSCKDSVEGRRIEVRV